MINTTDLIINQHRAEREARKVRKEEQRSRRMNVILGAIAFALAIVVGNYIMWH